MKQTLPLAVCVGEPAGIGIDVILAAWQQAKSGTIPPLPEFFLLCDPDHLGNRIRFMGSAAETAEIETPQAVSDCRGKLPVIRLTNKLKGRPAQPETGDAGGIVESISTAVSIVREGSAGGVVTLPINKKSLYDAGFDCPGHTEFLGALAEKWPGISGQVKPVMMLAGPKLRVVPVTIHIPLKDVPSSLTEDMIFDTAKIVQDDLRTKFGIATPRLAVSGLNPHAGEEGAMGEEDIAVIAPAIDRLRRSGVTCTGPLPADTMFHSAARETYDAAICMYHDQALIPAKALAFDETVNVTLGLPFIRTSPDHGTAFDIAGTGKARPESLIAAMRMAANMVDASA